MKAEPMVNRDGFARDAMLLAYWVMGSKRPSLDKVKVEIAKLAKDYGVTYDEAHKQVYDALMIS